MFKKHDNDDNLDILDKLLILNSILDDEEDDNMDENDDYIDDEDDVDDDLLDIDDLDII